jgi:uncharacterized protein with PIN domain
MSIPLYTDVNVRAEIATQLRVRGIDVLTAEEDGTREFPDADLLERAGQLGRLLFTRDRDFLVLAARLQRTGGTFGRLIYAHQLRASIAQCVDELDLVCKTGDLNEWFNRVGYLPLK